MEGNNKLSDLIISAIRATEKDTRKSTITCQGEYIEAHMGKDEKERE